MKSIPPQMSAESQNLMNPESDAGNPARKNFRLLKWNELVKHGDYIEDGKSGFEPWIGPAGFRAAAFIKTVYRKYSPRKKTGQTPV